MSSLKACLHSSVTSRSKLMTRSVILGTKDANNLDPIIYSIIVFIFKRQAPHQKRKVAHKKNASGASPTSNIYDFFPLFLASFMVMILPGCSESKTAAPPCLK